MRKNIKRKIGAFGAIFRGVRHQGRHRRRHTARGETRFGWTKMIRGKRQTATVDQMNTDTAIQDFYVVFPNLPALPNNPSS